MTSYKLLILRTYQFSRFCWLDYDQAFREHTAAEKVTDWSKMHVQLFNYHTAGAQVSIHPTSASVVSSQAEPSGKASSKSFAILGTPVIALQLIHSVSFAMHVAGAGALIMRLLVLLRHLLVLAHQILLY